MAAAAIAAISIPVRAQAQRGHALEYDASADCPARQDFERAVQERIGSNPFSADAPRTLSVELSGNPGARRATLRVSEDGKQQGVQSLESSSSACADLFSAAVAVASVMLDRPADSEPEPPPASNAVEPSRRTAAPPAPRPRPHPEPRSVDAKRLFVGVELAQDLALHGGGDACRPDSDRFDCYLEGTETKFDGTPADHTGKTESGVLLGAARLFATLTWELAPPIALDLRVGGAFGDTAPEFVPWHAEAGARYFLAQPSATLRGFVGASAGYAAFDTKLLTVVTDCDSLGPDCTPEPGDEPTRLDAVERRGPVFVAARAGVRWLLASDHALSPILSVYVPFPDTGLVLAPSLAYALGF